MILVTQKIIQRMQQYLTKKQADTQFICKLQDMMEKYPNILSWNDNGQQLVVIDLNLMQEEVLPSYFRHRNFGSFVRQLNMYSFHKVCRQNNSINFKNDIFFRGNEARFHEIKRKKKLKQQQSSINNFERQFQPLLMSIDEDPRLTGSVKNLMKNLIEFKYIAVENQKKIRKYLDAISRQLKQSRSKKVTHIVSQIKQNSIEKLDYNLKMSKSIDNYIQQSFIKDLKKINSSNSIPLLQQNKTINEIMMVDAKNINFHSQNSLMDIDSKKGSRQDYQYHQIQQDQSEPSIQQRMDDNIQ